MSAVFQIVGGLLILIAFGLGQTGHLNQMARSYIVLNLVGASILTASAFHEHQWGFVLLEGVWTLIAAWSLLRPSNRKIKPV
jgi:hypothetical protein